MNIGPGTPALSGPLLTINCPQDATYSSTAVRCRAGSPAFTGGQAGYFTTDNTGFCYGLIGETTWATTTNATGVSGWTHSIQNGAYGVFSTGNFGANGTKAFRIDHPDDPENKYLLHYCSESPDVINFYSGTVRLDAAGSAVVVLPHYFAKVNRDPRYTLTAIGAPMPQLHIAEEISESDLASGAACSFRIGGGAAKAKVSWRVDAVRNDLWVRSRGAPVELDKTGPERGTYQAPDLYGQPEERSTLWVATHPAPDQAASRSAASAAATLAA